MMQTIDFIGRVTFFERVPQRIVQRICLSILVVLCYWPFLHFKNIFIKGITKIRLMNTGPEIIELNNEQSEKKLIAFFLYIPFLEAAFEIQKWVMKLSSQIVKIVIEFFLNIFNRVFFHPLLVDFVFCLVFRDYLLGIKPWFKPSIHLPYLFNYLQFFRMLLRFDFIPTFFCWLYFLYESSQNPYLLLHIILEIKPIFLSQPQLIKVVIQTLLADSNHCCSFLQINLLPINWVQMNFSPLSNNLYNF